MLANSIFILQYFQLHLPSSGVHSSVSSRWLMYMGRNASAVLIFLNNANLIFSTNHDHANSMLFRNLISRLTISSHLHLADLWSVVRDFHRFPILAAHCSEWGDHERNTCSNNETEKQRNIKHRKNCKTALVVSELKKMSFLSGRKVR